MIKKLFKHKINPPIIYLETNKTEIYLKSESSKPRPLNKNKQQQKTIPNVQLKITFFTLMVSHKK